MREDGKKQWAYKASRSTTLPAIPKASEVTGNGFDRVWTTARP